MARLIAKTARARSLPMRQALRPVFRIVKNLSRDVMNHRLSLFAPFLHCLPAATPARMPSAASKFSDHLSNGLKGISFNSGTDNLWDIRTSINYQLSQFLHRAHDDTVKRRVCNDTKCNAFDAAFIRNACSLSQVSLSQTSAAMFAPSLL